MLWNNCCEHFLYAVTSNDIMATLPNDRPRRGTILPLVEIKMAAKLDVMQMRACTSYTADIQKHIGRLSDLKNRV